MLDAHFWLTAGFGLWNVVLTVLFWTRKPGEEAQAAVKTATDKFTTTIGELTNRVTTMEERTRNMPNDKEMGRMTGALERLEATVEGQKEALESMRIAMRRIEDYIYTHEKK